MWDKDRARNKRIWRNDWVFRPIERENCFFWFWIFFLGQTTKSVSAAIIHLFFNHPKGREKKKIWAIILEELWKQDVLGSNWQCLIPMEKEEITVAWNYPSNKGRNAALILMAFKEKNLIKVCKRSPFQLFILIWHLTPYEKYAKSLLRKLPKL